MALSSTTRENGVAPPDTAPALAAVYVAELRTVQPQGPYYLAGECIGGKLALEMGRLLRQEGEETFVVMLNTVVTGLAREAARNGLPPIGEQGDESISRNGRSNGAGASLHGVRRRLRELRRLPPKQRLPRLGRMIRNTATAVAPLTAAQQQQRALRAKRMNYMRLLRSFRPEAYDGEVIVLMTADLRARGWDETWRSYLRGAVRVDTLQGEHRTYLGEHVEINAACVRRWLSSAQDSAVTDFASEEVRFEQG